VDGGCCSRHDAIPSQIRQFLQFRTLLIETFHSITFYPDLANLLKHHYATQRSDGELRRLEPGFADIRNPAYSDQCCNRGASGAAGGSFSTPGQVCAGTGSPGTEILPEECRFDATSFAMD
jgi:hypothetical protein